MTGPPSAPRRTWIPLGRRLRLTATAAQRREILAAAARMTWTDAAADAFRHSAAPLRVVAAAVVGDLAQLRQVAVIDFGPGRWLVGLHDCLEARHYLLDQDSPGSGSWLREAIYLLSERPPPATRRRGLTKDSSRCSRPGHRRARHPGLPRVRYR